MEVLWFLVILGLGRAQFYPQVDFSNGCTIPLDTSNYGSQQSIILPPMMCKIVMRESARALGLLEPFVPVKTNQQMQFSQRAFNPAVISNMCNPPVTVSRAIECRRPDPPLTPVVRAIDCLQPQQLHQSSRGVECAPAPPPTAPPIQMPAKMSRAVECGPFGCYQPPPLLPSSRGLDCNLVPTSAAKFVGCAPNMEQEAEPVVPTKPPCPAMCNTICSGCQPAQHSSRYAEDAEIDLDNAGRAISAVQNSYNIIPVKLKSKTPGADEQFMNHLLLLQLKPDARKDEPIDGAQRNITSQGVRSL